MGTISRVKTVLIILTGVLVAASGVAAAERIVRLQVPGCV